MPTIEALAAQLAEERDVPTADMLEIVRTYAGQISDDPDLYNGETSEISDAGAEVIIDQVAAAAFAEPTLIDDLVEAQADVDRQDDRLGRRDAAIRKALSEAVPVREIVAHTGLSRERVYQIRDGRR